MRSMKLEKYVYVYIVDMKVREKRKCHPCDTKCNVKEESTDASRLMRAMQRECLELPKSASAPDTVCSRGPS